jgi:hypothetical protein
MECGLCGLMHNMMEQGDVDSECINSSLFQTPNIDTIVTKNSASVAL